MYPFNRHERLRESLSAHIDGRLSEHDRVRVESHLGACQACRAEIAGLRAAREALRGLPLAEAPRSFALTPEMTGAPSRPVATSYPALNAGMRLTAAGLAVALAVLMFVDPNGGSESESSRGGAVSRMEVEEQFSAADGGVANADVHVTAPDERDALRSPSNPLPAPAATGIPAAGPAATNAAESPLLAAGADDGEALAQTPDAKTADELFIGDLDDQPTDVAHNNGPSATAGGGRDGVSTQAAVEYILAALLGSAIGGAIALTAAERRRWR